MNESNTFTPRSRRYLAVCRQFDKLRKAFDDLDLAIYGMAYGDCKRNSAKAKRSLKRISEITNTISAEVPPCSD